MIAYALKSTRLQMTINTPKCYIWIICITPIEYSGVGWI